MNAPHVVTVAMLPQAGASPWPDRAIRDTIAVITRDADYQRALTQSLWDRFTRWLWDHLVDLVNSVSGSDFTRTVTIAMLVLVVVLVIARIAIGISAERALRHTGPGTRAGIGGEAMLASADALAAKGDFTGAAHALYAATLAALAARGEVRLHTSKTTGDYARELRRRTAAAWRPFQSFRSRYDRVIYGDMRCSEADYVALQRDARTMVSAAPAERAA